MNHIEMIEKLETICDYVYFQPPEGSKLVRPSFVVEPGMSTDFHTNNRLYRHQMNFSVTYITDSVEDITIIPKVLSMFPTAEHSATFTVDGFVHTQFTFHSITIKEN